MFFLSLLVYRFQKKKNVLFLILCIFSKFLFKKKNKKEDYFMLFYMTVTRYSRLFNWLLELQTVLRNVPKSLSWTWTQKKKIINKYYTRECISLFDGVESVVNVRFQVEKCGIRLRLLPLNITLPFVNTVVNTYPWCHIYQFVI